MFGAPFFCPGSIAILLSPVPSLLVSFTETTHTHRTDNLNEFANFLYSFSLSLRLFNHDTVVDLWVITFSLRRTEYHFSSDVCVWGWLLCATGLRTSAASLKLCQFLRVLGKEKMFASSGILPACPSFSTWAVAVWGHSSGQVQSLSAGLVFLSLSGAHTYPVYIYIYMHTTTVYEYL